MTCAKAIVLALASLFKSADAAALTKSIKRITSSRQDLMNVALMSYVKNYMILRGRKYTVQSNAQLHNAEVRRQMTARPSYVFD